VSNTSNAAALHASPSHATLPSSESSATGGRKPGKSGQAPAGFAQLLGNAAESERQKHATIPTPGMAAGSAAQLPARPNRNPEGAAPQGHPTTSQSSRAKTPPTESQPAAHEGKHELPVSTEGQPETAAEATAAKQSHGDGRPEPPDGPHDNESSGAQESRLEASGANRLTKIDLGTGPAGQKHGHVWGDEPPAWQGATRAHSRSDAAEEQGGRTGSASGTSPRREEAAPAQAASAGTRTEAASQPSRPSPTRAEPSRNEMPYDRKVDTQSGRAAIAASFAPAGTTPAQAPGSETSKTSKPAQAHAAQPSTETAQAKAPPRLDRQDGARLPESPSRAPMTFNEASAVPAGTFPAKDTRATERASAAGNPVAAHPEQPGRIHSTDGRAPLETRVEGPKAARPAIADHDRPVAAAQTEQPSQFVQANQPNSSQPQRGADAARSTLKNRTGRQVAPSPATSPEANAAASAPHAGSHVRPSTEATVQPAPKASSPSVVEAPADERAASADNYKLASGLSDFSATTFQPRKPIAAAWQPSLRESARPADQDPGPHSLGQHDHPVPPIAVAPGQAPSPLTRAPRPSTSAATAQASATPPHNATRIVPSAPSTQVRSSAEEGAALPARSPAERGSVGSRAMDRPVRPGEQPEATPRLAAPPSARPQAGEASRFASASRPEARRAAPTLSGHPANSAPITRDTKPAISPTTTTSALESEPQTGPELPADSTRARSAATPVAASSPPPHSRDASVKPRAKDNPKTAPAPRDDASSDPAPIAHTARSPRAGVAATPMAKTPASAPQPQPIPTEMPAAPETARTSAETEKRPANAQPADAESTTRTPPHRGIRPAEQLSTAARPQAQPVHASNGGPADAARVPTTSEHR
jgi:hypothetical protein